MKIMTMDNDDGDDDDNEMMMKIMMMMMMMMMLLLLFYVTAIALVWLRARHTSGLRVHACIKSLRHAVYQVSAMRCTKSPAILIFYLESDKEVSYMLYLSLHTLRDVRHRLIIRAHT